MWYCRHEIQFRQALFFLSGLCCGCALADSWRSQLGNGRRRRPAGMALDIYPGGIATVLVAVMALLRLQDFPETATFLTEEERAFVIHETQVPGPSARWCWRRPRRPGVRSSSGNTFARPSAIGRSGPVSLHTGE